MSMPDTFHLLGREVKRVVTAPYAPCLQDLHSLAQRVQPANICSWASHKPCQAGALVDVLVDGLSRSQFALHLLATFASAPEFRNAMLERYPYILDQLLSQSVDNWDSEYPSVCITALSSPLPHGFIAPASLASFITKMVNKMKENPCTETVTPLHLISNSLRASPGVLAEIPAGVMSSFQTELTKTLRNLEDHMGNLLCLATFANIASSQTVASESRRSVDDPAWLQSIKHFFGPRRGSKTLDLVVLRVILACSSNGGNLTTEQSAESIRLAIEICDSVGKEQKESWFAGNSVKLAKLCEKIKHDGINKRVQTLAVVFLVSLVPGAGFSADLLKPALDLILSEDSRIVLEFLPAHLVSRLVEASAARTGQSAVCRTLDYIFSALDMAPASSTSISKLQMAKLFLEGICGQPTLPDILSRRYKDLVEKLLGHFPRRPTELNCTNSTTCCVLLSQHANELFYDFLVSYFQSSLPQDLSKEKPQSLQISSFITFTARNKHLLPKFKCAFLETRPLDLRKPISALKVHDYADTSRHDWRSGIAEMLATNARVFNDTILQKVEHICYDLELRCDNIEAPLKTVEKEREKIALEAEQLKRQNEDLKSRLQQGSSTITELREEMSHLESHADSATLRVEELSGTLEQARQELEDFRRGSQETISSERESARSRELDLIASITEKDDRLEEMQEKIKSQNEENSHLRLLLDSISKEKSGSAESIVSLQEEISLIQGELDKTQILLEEKEEKIERLLAENTTASDIAEDLQRKLDEKASESENLRSTLDDFKIEIAALKEQSEQQYLVLTGECTKQKEQNFSLQRAMQEATSSVANELQTREKRIQHLERKVQHLREERAAKAREFSEAQQHIGRLMGVMGFKNGPTESRVSSKQRPRSTIEPSQAAAIRRQTNLGEEHVSHQNDDLTTTFETNRSHPGGRSPKRSRNSAFPPTEQSPQRRNGERKPRGSATPSCRSSAGQQRDRRSLGDLNQNSQPNSQLSDVPPSTQCEAFQESQVFHQGDENRLEEIDLDMDLEFPKDFIFTGTSLSDLNEQASA